MTPLLSRLFTKYCINYIQLINHLFFIHLFTHLFPIFADFSVFFSFVVRWYVYLFHVVLYLNFLLITFVVQHVMFLLALFFKSLGYSSGQFRLKITVVIEL